MDGERRDGVRDPLVLVEGFEDVDRLEPEVFGILPVAVAVRRVEIAGERRQGLGEAEAVRRRLALVVDHVPHRLDRPVAVAGGEVGGGLRRECGGLPVVGRSRRGRDGGEDREEGEGGEEAGHGRMPAMDAATIATGKARPQSVARG